MARYKYIDTSPRFLPVDLAKQLLPGTFEHAVHHLLEHAIDLSAFDARFHNDTTGATAYPPSMLLEVVLCAYAHGIVSSRGIERACREHVTFIALCGDTAPHFTTIAHLVSTLGDEIAHVFAAVLAVCDREGLIGREMFAIDGVKLPGNASKRRSGTRAEFERQASKLEAAAATMLARHRAADALPVEPTLAAKETTRIARLEEDAAQIRDWLTRYPEERRGPKGTLRQSNRTDNESAKMATEQELLLPVVTAMTAMLSEHSLITADASYHSEANLAADMRKRDDRFATQGRHRETPEPLYDKSKSPRALPVYQPSDFIYDAEARTCVCPAGNSLYRAGRALITKGHIGDHFRGAKRDCIPCAHRARCLRDPEKTPVRQVAFFHGKTDAAPATHTARMQQRIDSSEGRARYAKRFGTVEPVFANLRYNKRLDRFTLRGRAKVDGQWKLFCLVHNIEKLAHHGYAA